jgi:hypothetical protein
VHVRHTSAAASRQPYSKSASLRSFQVANVVGVRYPKSKKAAGARRINPFLMKFQVIAALCRAF